jgi:DNA-binding NarL/FixJ family response regulator
MSAVSLPVSRPAGQAMVIAGASSRQQPVQALERLGYSCAEADDPYSAMIEICRKPLAYRAVILGLNSLFREELAIVAAIKQRFGHIEVWLTQTDGRQSSLAEAMRLGADGLLGEDGLHRVAVMPAVEPVAAAVTTIEEESAPEEPAELPMSEPVLTADELRALLQEAPAGNRVP